MIAVEDLRLLAGVPGPCLSIFQPIRDNVSQVAKTETRLVAAAQAADALLEKRGMPADDRERFLRPILKLANNTDWASHTGAIVIFRAPGFIQSSFWPDALDAAVHVQDEFVVLPLIPGLHAQRSFWILALSINRVRLLRATPKGLSEIDLPAGVPRSLIEAGGFDAPEGDLEARSAAGSSTGNMHAVRFGTTSANETTPRYLHDFFKAVDRGIHGLLAAAGHDPLVLAAVTRELAIYKEINTWQFLLDESIHGSPDSLGNHRLFSAAADLVAKSAPVNGRSHQDVEAAAGRGLLLRELPEILEAARNGQVARLLIPPTGHHDSAALNSAVLAVLAHRGNLAADAGTGLSAVLRYRAA